MTVNERIQYIYNAARKAGVTHQGAIGLLGNLQGETSDFDPMSLETLYRNRFGLTDAEYTRRADAGEYIINTKTFEFDSAGYGIAQWTWWARKRGLREVASILGKSVGDLDVQVAYMLQEMQTRYTETWEVLTTTDDYRKAVKICVTDYEKPADSAGAIAKRTEYAKKFLATIPDTKAKAKEEFSVATVTTAQAIAALIAWFKGEVGYIEKRTNAQLQDKIANAGNGNYTKYAEEIDTKYPNFYNGPKNGFPWCDVFLDDGFINVFGYDMAIKLLCTKEKSSGAGCIYSADYYRSKGRFFKTPQVGDQIFFGSAGNETHTGIVVAVTSSTVTTIEGNTSSEAGVVPNGGMVCEKDYPRNKSYIVGYGRPDYSLVTSLAAGVKTPEVKAPEEAKKEAAVANTATEKDVRYVEVTLKTLQKGENGTQVETLQSLLIKKFKISCGKSGMDGDFGADTDKAVRTFQKKKGLEVDGICGKDTWTALLAG